MSSWFFRSLCLMAAMLTFPGCGGKPATTPAPTAPATAGVPKAVLATKALDAGDVDFGQRYDFTFPITNSGTAPLRVELSRRSCSCAEIEAPAELAPGTEGQIKLQWKPIPGMTSPYVLTLEMKTNDPALATIPLSVRATLKPLVRIDPEGDGYIDFGDAPIRPSEKRQREIRIFSTELASFEVQATCSHPGIKIVPPSPIPAGSVGSHQAKSGYAITLEATDALPRGYVQETLSLAISAPGRPPRTLTMPVYAVVENGTFALQPQQIVFKKPNIREEDIFRTRVTFFVPTGEETLEIARVEPPFLKAEVAKKDGRWELITRLPANHPEALKFQPDRFMEGRVILKSGKTEVPIRVKWHPPEN